MLSLRGYGPTNCKINSMILNHQYLNGHKVNLYFHKTDDYKRIESLLVRLPNLPCNGFGTHIEPLAQSQNVLSKMGHPYVYVTFFKKTIVSE